VPLRHAPAHCDQAFVGGWPGPGGVSLQAPVPGRVDPRGAGATGFHRPFGGECICFPTVDGPNQCIDGATLCAGLEVCAGSDECDADEACVQDSCCGVPVCAPNLQVCTDGSAAVVNFSFEGQGPTLGQK
jgi:hypothetical protein